MKNNLNLTSKSDLDHLAKRQIQINYQSLMKQKKISVLKRKSLLLKKLHNLANWIIHGANTWLKPLYDKMHDALLEETVLHADETTIQVLDEVGKKPTSKSYMWLYGTGMYSNPIFLYEYQPSRANKHPRNFLK